jgi:hypothetical protein
MRIYSGAAWNGFFSSQDGESPRDGTIRREVLIPAAHWMLHTRWWLRIHILATIWAISSSSVPAATPEMPGTPPVLTSFDALCSRVETGKKPVVSPSSVEKKSL